MQPCIAHFPPLEWSSNVNGTLLVMFGMLLSVYPCDLQTWTAHSWWCLACCCQCIRVIFKRERHTPGDVWHVVVCVSVWSSNVNGTLLVMFGMLLSMIFIRERHTPGDVWHVVVSVSVWSSNVNGTLLVMFGMLLSVYPCDLQTWTAHSWWCLACCCLCIRVIFKRERHIPGDVWHVVVCVSVWSSNVNGTFLVMFGMLLSVYPCEWSSNVNGTFLVMFGMLLSVYPCDLQTWTAHSWWCVACCCLCIRVNDLQTWTAHSWWCLACCCLCIRVIFKCERHTPGDVWHVVVCVSVWSSNVNGTLLVMCGMLLSVYPCDLQTWTAHSWWCLACCCLCIRVTSNVNGTLLVMCGMLLSVYPCEWSSNVNGTLLVMCGMLLSVYPCEWSSNVNGTLLVMCGMLLSVYPCEWSSNVNGTLLVMCGMLLSVYPCDLQTWTAHSWWCLACCCLYIRVTSYNGSADIALSCMLYHIQLLSIGTVSFLSESTCVLWAHSCPANVSRIGHRDTILCSVHVST